MKNVITLGLLVCLSFALLVNTTVANPGSEIYVNPVLTSAGVGDSIAVGIDINTSDDVFAVQYNVFFDPTILNASSVVEGSFLKQGLTPPSQGTFPVISIDNGLGIITFASTRFGVVTGATGIGTFMTINFDTMATGTSQVGIDSVALVDTSINPIVTTAVNGSIVVNQPPQASNLQITPSSPVTTDDLTGSYNYFDPDGHAESGSEIRWHRNGLVQSAYNDLLTVPSSATAKGEAWYFTVRPSDGFDFGSQQVSPVVAIQNSPPAQPTVDVTPDSPITSDDLVCTNTTPTTDVDGDPVTYLYAWEKDNVLQPALITSTVSSSLTSKGEAWLCYMVAYDGIDFGASGSDSVMIQNSAPVFVSVSPLSAGLETREGFDLQFNQTSSDPDSDTISYSWLLNGTEMATTSSWLFSPTTSECGSSDVAINITDGLLSASSSWTVDVGLRGDADSNRDVNIFDLATVGIAFGSQTGGTNWKQDADLSPGPGTDGSPEGDGIINIFDLATVGVNYGRSC
jgi:hypothetical protein